MIVRLNNYELKYQTLFGKWKKKRVKIRRSSDRFIFLRDSLAAEDHTSGYNWTVVYRFS